MIPAFLLLLKGKTLGQTLYNVVVLVAAIGFIALLGLLLVFGNGWKSQKAKADAARAGERAQAAAADANAGAALNSTATRAAMDSAIIEVRVTSDQAARKIEDAKYSVGADGALPDDLVRELEAASGRAAAAGDRLQRKGAR